MGLDLWFREDVMRTLQSLAQAQSRYAGEFSDGYQAALWDLAVAFGIREPMQAGEKRLLDVERGRYANNTPRSPGAAYRVAEGNR
jgi:hypothetical protein